MSDSAEAGGVEDWGLMLGVDIEYFVQPDLVIFCQ